MSFRAVDLQIAVHRNGEIGQVQHHLQQRPVQDQLHLGAQAGKEAEHGRQMAAKLEETAEAEIRDRQSGGKQREGRRGASGKNAAAAQAPSRTAAQDPYKGRHIDYSL